MLSTETFKKYTGAIAVWGEASFILHIISAFFIRHYPQAGDVAAKSLIKKALSQILEFNGRNSKDLTCFIPPHFDLNFAVRRQFDLLDDEFEDSYKFSSHFLKLLIEVLARWGERDFIAENWKEISFMHLEEFVPDNLNDFYLWRIEKGEDRSVIPNKEQSWSQLQDAARMFEGNSLPPTLRRFPEFLPFFLSLFPHRVTSESIGFLDRVSASTR